MKPSGEAAPRSNHPGIFVRYAQSLYQILRDRRKFERVPVTGAILATYGGAVLIQHTCTCVDMSPRGIAIDSPEPIEPNTFVALRSDERDPKRWARVRYCRPHDVVHRIGLEFIAHDAGAEM